MLLRTATYGVVRVLCHRKAGTYIGMRETSAPGAVAPNTKPQIPVKPLFLGSEALAHGGAAPVAGNLHVVVMHGRRHNLPVGVADRRLPSGVQSKKE